MLWGAEPRFELGPALQQADALLSVPRRTRALFQSGVVGVKMPLLIHFTYFSNTFSFDFDKFLQSLSGSF
jgi:hypothetical protein